MIHMGVLALQGVMQYAVVLVVLELCEPIWSFSDGRALNKTETTYTGLVAHSQCRVRVL